MPSARPPRATTTKSAEGESISSTRGLSAFSRRTSRASERKLFASLSHESNKAMNLNSYLGLMGGSFAVVDSPGGQVLVSAGSQHADFAVSDSDYVLTLDADSVLLPEYCLRLVYFMEQSENSNVAVVQTPSSAYPILLRASSASPEQPPTFSTSSTRASTASEATFWVGANAVIRKRALEELEEQEDEAGFTISRFIKDRTVMRGYGVEHRPESKGLEPLQLSGKAELQCDTARLRRIGDPKAALGERWSRHST